MHGSRMRARLRVSATARLALAVTLVTFVGVGVVAGASADSTGPINFESPAYTIGNINGQQGWMKTGVYDVAVADVSAFPAAAGYGFGAQALRLSDSVTSGSFGDQTFSPVSQVPPVSRRRRTTSMRRSSSGLRLQPCSPACTCRSAPTTGVAHRMSYLRFEDQLDGVHVFFDDVTNSVPIGHASTFNESDIKAKYQRMFKV